MCFFLVVLYFVFFLSQRKLILEFIDLVWEHVSFGEEIIILGKLFPHKHKILAKFIFVTNHLNTWPLGDPLVWLELGKNIRRDGQIKPDYVKIFFLHLVGLLSLVRIMLSIRVDIQTRVRGP